MEDKKAKMADKRVEKKAAAGTTGADADSSKADRRAAGGDSRKGSDATKLDVGAMTAQSADRKAAAAKAGKEGYVGGNSR
jgi:hypothetical protein